MVKKSKQASHSPISSKSKVNKKVNSWNPSDEVTRFMLAERQDLSERWTHSDQMAEGRLNIFITIASGATGVLILLSQLKVTSKDFTTIGLIIFFLIWLLGLITFARMLERNIVVVSYIRAINRTRRFFVDAEPKIENYLALPATDSEPKFTSLGARKFGARTISAVICSLAFGLFCWAIFTLTSENTQLSYSSVIIFFITFISHLIILEVYASKRLSTIEKKYDVHFPTKY